MLSSILFSIGLLSLLTTLLVIPGLRQMPGVGVLPSILIIALIVWLRGNGLEGLGLVQPLSWSNTIGMSLIFGILIALLSPIIIEPFSEHLTGKKHDLSALGTIRGDIQNTLTWITGAWLLAATLEEIIFRGFMMRELADLLGTGFRANTVNILVTSTVFGLAHLYQGRAGALSTAIVSVMLGVIFVWNEFQLWLLIFTHGFIDTFGLLLIYLGWDEHLNRVFFRQEHISQQQSGEGP
jgi:membrane protease YdiL (CAAX protease family)